MKNNLLTYRAVLNIASRLNIPGLRVREIRFSCDGNFITLEIIQSWRVKRSFQDNKITFMLEFDWK